MSDVAVPAPVPDQPGLSSNWRQHLSHALIVVAFLIPLTAGGLGYLTAEGTLRAAGSVLGSWGVLWFIAWLVTRKRGAVARSRGALVVSLLLVLSVSGNLLGDVRLTAQTRDFVRQGQAMQARQEQSFAEVARKFEAFGDVSKVLSPEAFVRPAANMLALHRLDQFRGLITERGALLRKNLADAEKFIDTQAPTRAVRDGEMRDFQVQQSDLTRLFADLDKAQLALLDAYAELLRWGNRQGSSLTLRNGQILFSTREQHAQFKRIFDQAVSVENRYNEVFKAFQAGMAKVDARAQAGNARMNAFLGKQAEQR